MQQTGRKHPAVNRLAATVLGGDKPDRPQNGNAAGRLTTILSAVLLVLAGVLVSAARSTEIKPRSNSVVACVTLEAVRTHGFLDEVGYRRVVRSLAAESNPYRDEFPESYRAFIETCATLRAVHKPKTATIGKLNPGND